MKNIFKLILVISVSILAITSLTVTANQDITVGEPVNGIFATFDPALAGGTWDGNLPRKAGTDGKQLLLEPDNAGNIWGFYAKGLKAGVYKVGYYMTITNITDEGSRMRFKPYGGDTYLDMNYSDLKQHEGKKVLVVAPIKLTEDRESTEVGAWMGRGLNGTLDKIVIATSDYNFMANKDFTLIKESVADSGPDENKPAEGEWTPSAAVEEPTDPEPTDPEPTDDPGDGNNQTSDAPILMTLILAGASSLGALKLKKK
jgi:hypothetical protein